MRLKFLAGVVPTMLAFSSLAFAQAAPPPAAGSTQASVSTSQPAPTTSTSSTLGLRNIGNADNMASLFGVVGYRYSNSSALGLGARFQKTLVSDVVFKDHATIKDDFGIEAGIDWLHYNFDTYGYDFTYNEFVIVVGGVWNVWLNDNLAIYPKIDLGYGFGSGGAGGYSGGNDEFVGQVSAGVMYKIFPVVLRAELGTWSLRLGAGFQF